MARSSSKTEPRRAAAAFVSRKARTKAAERRAEQVIKEEDGSVRSFVAVQSPYQQADFVVVNVSNFTPALTYAEGAKLEINHITTNAVSRAFGDCLVGAADFAAFKAALLSKYDPDTYGSSY